MTVSASIGWPAAATRPRAPLRATIARIIFEHAVQRVPVRVTYPDGRVLGGGSGTSPEFTAQNLTDILLGFQLRNRGCG